MHDSSLIGDIGWTALTLVFLAIGIVILARPQATADYFLRRSNARRFARRYPLWLRQGVYTRTNMIVSGVAAVIFVPCLTTYGVVRIVHDVSGH